MDKIEGVERISEGSATQLPRRIAKKSITAARGIKTRSGRIEEGTVVVVIPANGFFGTVVVTKPESVSFLISKSGRGR